MNSRLVRALSPLATPAALLVLVVVLGFGFLAVVLVPGLELAGEVAESSTALKLLGDEQRHPTLIRAALESVHDRLGDHGYVQESLDQLRASSSKLDAALHEMTVPRPVSWFALTADTGATGTSMAGKHAAQLLDNWARERVVLKPVLAYQGVPYQDNESTGTTSERQRAGFGSRRQRGAAYQPPCPASAGRRTDGHCERAADDEFACRRRSSDW